MTISYVGAGTFDSGTTSCACNFLSGAASDLILALIGNKPYSSSPTVSGYTGLGGVTSGSVANGNGTGSTRATVGVRQTVPTSSGSDTVSVTSGSPTMAIGLRFACAAGAAFSLQGFGLADTDETLVTVSASATIASNAIQLNDWLVISVVLKDDAITHSTQLLTISGVTHGSITWLAKQSTTSGNDGAMYIGYCQVTGGASNGGTGTYSATSNTSGASAAAVNLIRLREVTATPANLAATAISSSQVDVSWDAVTGATAYTLERSYDGSTGWSTVYSGTSTTYSDTSAESALQYFYRISATSSLGTSAVSANVSATTPFAMPFTENYGSGEWRSTRWTTAVAAPGVVDVVSGEGRLSTPSGGASARAILTAGSSSTTDQGVLLKVTSINNAATHIVLRGDGWTGTDPTDGYVVKPTLSGFGVTLYRFTSGSGTSLGSATVPTAPFWLRFETVGTAVRFRMWDASGSEPSTWDVDTTDATWASGRLQLGYTNNTGSASAITVDDVTYYVPSTTTSPQPVRTVTQQARIRSNLY